MQPAHLACCAGGLQLQKIYGTQFCLLLGGPDGDCTEDLSRPLLFYGDERKHFEKEQSPTEFVFGTGCTQSRLDLLFY